VKSVNDLVVLTPGLSVNTNQGESTTIIRIRGVGNVADNPGLEQSVGLYIDGVYRPCNGVSFNDLGELSDIEILKGPQGTLFGKNTIAGVVQVTTLRPSFKFGATGEVTAQNENGYGGSITVTGPLVGDVLAGRLYIGARERDGYADVKQAPGGDIPKQDDEHMWTTRGQLLWQPNNNFDVNFIADYSKRDDHCCVAMDYLNGDANVGVPGGPAGLINFIFPGSIPSPVSGQNHTAYLNRTNEEHIVDEGVSANIGWTTPWFDGAKLTSITAFRDNKDAGGGDTDSTLADFLYTSPKLNFTQFRQFSEELQYRGSTDRLDWQLGAFFSHEILDNGASTQFGTQLGPYVAALSPLPAAFFPANEGSIDRYHQTEDGEAIYTQEKFKLTDKLSLIGGLRYTWEHKHLNSSYTAVDAANACATVLFLSNGDAPVPLSQYVDESKGVFSTPCLINPAFNGLKTSQSLNESALTGTAKLQYQFSRDDMTYVSYSRGNLVGGFNLAEVTQPLTGTTAPNTSLAPQTDTSFPVESVDAYEVGAKTLWFDRRLVLNGAVFYQTYTNHQLNAFTGTQFVEFTIPEATAEGVELEGAWAATHDLGINFGLTWADTFYPNDAKNKSVLQAPESNLYLLPGNRLSYAPFWSGVLGADYKHELFSGLKGEATMDLKYTSDYQVGSDEDPSKLQKGYALVDASVSVTTPDNHIKVSLLATNLFNQFYKQAAFDGVIQTLSPIPANTPALNNYYYFPSPPRFFGVTLKVKY
jgi:outer membrane receptor protein involved in Fe transport